MSSLGLVVIRGSQSYRKLGGLWAGPNTPQNSLASSSCPPVQWASEVGHGGSSGRRGPLTPHVFVSKLVIDKGLAPWLLTPRLLALDNRVLNPGLCIHSPL